MAREILKIKTYVDGVNDIPFPSASEQIGITEYTYTSKRMGGVTLSATLMYRECLDKKWTGLQYVEFRGEKYFISATPSSGKDNEDARYEHTLSFVPERDLKLNNVYFYDAVSDESTGDDKYKSNSTKVVFFGTIQEFVARLNESLKYSGLDYTVVIDEGITSEGKLMSFEDQFFFNVLQEIYNTYELPFYFVGKVIHIGFTSNAITQTFKYGFENELLSIKKNNANYRIINRCTGIGSEDNIPYYYPNNSAKGDLGIEVGKDNVTLTAEDVIITDYELFSDKIAVGRPITYKNVPITGIEYDESPITEDGSIRHGARFDYHVYFTPESVGNVKIKTSWSVSNFRKKSDNSPVSVKYESYLSRIMIYKKWDTGPWGGYESVTDPSLLQNGGTVSLNVTEGDKEHMIGITGWVEYTQTPDDGTILCDISISAELQNPDGWVYGDGGVSLEDIGIKVNVIPTENDSFSQKIDRYITPSANLMPTVYRESGGAERFYNALNDTYTNPETGDKYVFENEYDPMIPREHKQEFEDIKPTIKGMTNAAGQRMDQILDIAFDDDDNDEFDPDNDNNYLHPYFFVKLPKYDGDYGFNLFDHSIDEEEMSISMTSGQCGACEFIIGVSDDDSQKNLVQVDENGNLLRDENGNVRCGRKGMPTESPQDRQNDTVNNEVWIALKKEESTYGQIMPNAQQNLRPAAGDTFAILHIDLPAAYILNAENELKEAIIKYMAQNNSEKFNFSITFSRIYLAEHPEVEAQLNENARIQVEYDGTKYEFYISQYTYKCLDDEALPEITVEITDTITVNKTTLQNTADSIRQDMNDALGNIDFLTMGLQYFIRKDVEDEALGKIKFRGGVEFGYYERGALGSGGAVRIDENGASHAEFDYLDIRRIANFKQLNIEELKHIGGEFILSPASIICSEVLDMGDSYRCYFENTGENGEKIYNKFVAGDQARKQAFNEWSGDYYWRLVVGVGDNYIDLSKSDADDYSRIPQAGDNIVQMGNRTEPSRQSVIILSTIGENAPSYVIYNGINSYSLDGKTISGNVFNPDTNEPQLFNYGQMFFGDRDIDDPDSTFITFQQKEGDTKKRIYVKGGLTLTEGSSGLSNLEEWTDAEQSIQDAQNTANEALGTANEAKDYIDNTLPSEIAEINNRLDGVVENWFYKYTPSRQNEPAATWIADGEEADHAGDTFTNIQEYVDDETTPDAGKSWRWALIDGQYDWTPIADSDAVKALQDAAKAQDTADQKRRVFVTTPYTPYDVGDMWTQGPDGEIMRCIKARATGNYTASDWDKASKYTDDTVAQDALDKARQAQRAADAAQDAADAAQAAASQAQSTADNAVADASEANTQLANLMSDSVITPPEKTALKQQHSDIKAEYTQIIADAQKYGVSTTTYTNAYNSANTALTKYTAASPENITVGSDYSNISAYYTARQTILNAIATAAKNAADAAQDAADAAQGAADAAQSTADSAAASASQALKDAAAAQSAIQEVRGDLNGLNDTVSDLDEYLDGAFRDGVINDAESISIKKYINTVNESWTDLQASYNVVYNNANLTGTPKTNLNSAYSTLSTRKNALIAAINTAVSNPSTANVTAVDTAFTSYNSAVASFKTALENATKSIEDAIRTAANNAAAAAQQAQNAAAAVSESVEGIKNFTDTAFADGVINRAEAAAIEKYRNTVNETLKSVTGTYNTLYSNANLTGTPKTNLKTTYDSLVSAINALLDSIDTAIADSKTNATEKADVDSKYNTVNTRMQTYTQAVEAANESIQAAIKAIADNANNRLNNIEYLKALFPNSTLVAGATISQMAVVTDKNPDDGGKVIAGLNGTDNGKDSTHGKVLLFAGSDGIDETGEKISNAKTRIYEDGHIASESVELTGKINAESGKIGSAMEIDDMWLYMKLPNNEKVESGISPSRIYFENTGESNYESSFTAQAYPTPSGGSASNFICQIKSSYLGNENADNVALLLSVTGNSSRNIAISCLSGMFAGLRPNTRVLTGSDHLSELDNIIICVGPGAMYVYLPTNPQNGQVYQIWQAGNCERRINGLGKSINWTGVQSGAEQILGTTDYRVVHLVWHSNLGYWMMYASPTS